MYLQNNNYLQPKLPTFVFILFLVFCTCHATDTITKNTSLSGDQTIISKEGIFELGFFKPGNSSNYYIGIWYKSIPVKTIVWVANRDRPVSDKYTASLKISDDGNLVLVTNMSNLPIWSTNLTSKIPKSIEVVLLDKGNLVLRGVSNSTSPIWQSFDHPTDTLLPSGKVGFNKKTNWTGVLTSWKNSENPAMGIYSVECDRSSKVFGLAWNKTRRYWSSGVWISDQHIFTNMPELRYLTHPYSFRYVDNENETYITYDVDSNSFLSRFVMDVSGQIRSYAWFNTTQEWVLYWGQPGQQCAVEAKCGAYGTCNQNTQPYCSCLPGFNPKSINEWDLSDFSGGCARKTALNCENSGGSTDRDKFWASPSTVLPDIPHSISASSLSKCEQACLNNCSCTAYAYINKECSIWFGDLLNVKKVADTNTGSSTLYIRVAASEIQTKSHKKLVVAISSAGIAGLVILLGLIFMVFFMRKRGLFMSAKSIGTSLTRFSYRDLQYATKNFSQRLGGGGFGTVFKGTLQDSTAIAVKNLERIGEGQGEKQFRAEVSAIATIQHVNLVRLCGFCSEGLKRLLVYEYMPNGSLDSLLLKDKTSQIILTWKVRYQIAIGIAKGLAYLHEKCRDCIIHCDIKPENILLDAQLCPKVADFGLAKLLGREFSRVLTTIRGTRGYLAPEWISGEAITAKIDVYSYGMVLFELISGRRNTRQKSDGRLDDFFPTWALMKVTTQGEDVLSVVDSKLEDVEKNEVMIMLKLACWCIQDGSDQRPTMGQAIQVLEGILDIDMPSMPRSFDILADDESAIS